MQITETKAKVSNLCKDYSDNGDGGVFGFDGKLKDKPSIYLARPGQGASRT